MRKADRHYYSKQQRYLRAVPRNITLPRIVVVGAGFGGLEAVKALGKYEAEVVLIDKHNYHHFTPLLYQVAAAELETEEITFPIRSIISKQANASFLMAEVTSIDRVRQVVVTDQGEVSYDVLILALGSRTDYFDIPGARDHAFPMKVLSDGVKLRNHILRCFEKAEYEQDPTEKERLLTFVIVGAGPSGVEYAGALATLVYGPMTREFRNIHAQDVHLVLVDGSTAALKQFHPKLSEYARRRLQKMGVDVLLENKVVRVSDEHLWLSTGAVIATNTVIWNAGVRGHKFVKTWGFATNEKDQIRVRQTLQSLESHNVFAIGDMAILPQPLPMMAMPAIQQGKCAAINAIRLLQGLELKKFRYKSYGTMAVIGRNAAVVQLGKLRLKGFVAWSMWSILHLFKLLGARNKLNILVNWVWQYITFNSAVRVILEDTGADPIKTRTSTAGTTIDVAKKPTMLKVLT